MYTGQPTALMDRVNITACPCNECNKHTKMSCCVIPLNTYQVWIYNRKCNLEYLST